MSSEYQLGRIIGPKVSNGKKFWRDFLYSAGFITRNVCLSSMKLKGINAYSPIKQTCFSSLFRNGPPTSSTIILSISALCLLKSFLLTFTSKSMLSTLSCSDLTRDLNSIGAVLLLRFSLSPYPPFLSLHIRSAFSIPRVSLQARARLGFIFFFI